MTDRRVTTILVNEVEQITGDLVPTEGGISYIADSIILLRYAERAGRVIKVIACLKKRYGSLDPSLCELEITSEGLKVGRELKENMQGVPGLCLRIEDTGSGIDPDFAARIFEPFEQESSGLTRLHEGSGLGLSIARQLAELMNGKISVESQKGEGSTFTVAFPRTQETSSPDAESERPEKALQDTRILVVEDNEDTRRLIELILGKKSDVCATGTVREAIRQARDTAFDLAFVDINLGTPEGGLEVLHQLRTWPAYESIPIVAMTAYAMPGDRERFLREGFDAYLSKPFTSDELLDVAAQLLG